MSLLSVLALLLSFACLGMVYSRLRVIELVALVLLLLIHVGASFSYYGIAQTNVADSYAYYNDLFHAVNKPFGLSTIFVAKLVHFLKVNFGATYLDCFMLFQALGFAGLIILARTFFEIEENIRLPYHRSYLGLLFIPSAIYWTGAIGKDAPVFFAISLLVWAMLKLKTRFIQFCFALLVLVLFRAHIALMAVTAFAAAALMERRVSIGHKFGLLAIAVAGFLLLIGPVRQSIDLDVTSMGSVTTFLNEKNSIYTNVGGTTSIGSASYPVKLFSLLFRPFFFDAPGFGGVVASFENVGVVLAFGFMIVRWRDLAHLLRRVFFVRFVVAFEVVLLFSLSLVYYNVGLGLRERIMAFPMFVCTLVALWVMRRKQIIVATAPAHDELMAIQRPDTPLAQR
jgi:hypothetical protein